MKKTYYSEGLKGYFNLVDDYLLFKFNFCPYEIMEDDFNDFYLFNNRNIYNGINGASISYKKFDKWIKKKGYVSN